MLARAYSKKQIVNSAGQNINRPETMKFSIEFPQNPETELPGSVIKLLGCHLKESKAI